MTENAPPDREADDLGLTDEEWEYLKYAYNCGWYEPAPGTVEAEAFRQMDDEVPQIFRTGDPIGFSPERNGIKCRGNQSITLRSSRSRPSRKWSTPRRRGRLPRLPGNSISMILRSGSG